MQKLGMTRIAMMVFILVVSAAAALPQGQEPESPTPGATGVLNTAPFRLRVDVNLAQIDVAVQDRAGKPMDNLRISDFRLFENGVERPLQTFSMDDRPLAIAVVVDRSRLGADRQFPRSVKKAASQSLSPLQRGDSACLFVFGYTVELLEGLTMDLKRVLDSIDSIVHYGGGTPITKGGVYVAVHEAIAYLARTAPDKHRAVFLFSDNRDYSTGEVPIGFVPDYLPLPFSLEQTIQLALRSGTPVYSIKPPDRIPRSQICCGADIDPRLTNDTGGELFEGSESAIEKALAGAIGQVKPRYTLSYGLGTGGVDTRRIEVRLTDRFGQPNSDYRIHASSGSYSEPPVDSGATTSPARVSSNNVAGVQTATEIEFVKVASGSFMMGPDWDSETKEHKVTLTKAFELGRFEVTQAQWQAVMGNNLSDFKGDSNPVNNVSWNEVQEFIRSKNARNDGYRYRLPTDAEWEYAAHGGTTGPTAGASVTKAHTWYDALDKIGWYAGNSGNQLHPVGQKAPNDWGLYDMHGNVWEWIADWYGADYSRGAAVDPKGPSTGTSRVLRGGSWNYLSEHAYTTKRWYSAPGNRSSVIGFRLVRERS